MNYLEHKSRPCDHTHCMHNVEGKCWHSKCAITDPSYKMPGKVADEKARTWHKYHKIDPKELKDDEE